MDSKIFASVACNLDQNILQAVLPLFEKEQVEAIEWSFDTLYKVRNIPDWFVELIKAFGEEGRLIGHGVFFSLFSGQWKPEQTEWLHRLRLMSQEFKFDHITEHFGFMTGEDFHKGAPISIPFTKEVLAIGHDRIKRICDACQCPVGLENLAFAYSLDEVKRHGDFLAKLMEPTNGFIILDLHNLYCQLYNFHVSYEDIIQLYPLDMVREIHISGGSWEDSSVLNGEKIRRDTHDEAVPSEVFDLLEKTIPQCPNLKFVVLEQIGTGLVNTESQHLFRHDFSRLQAILEEHKSPKGRNDFGYEDVRLTEKPLENELLHQQQTELSSILETAINYEEVVRQLSKSSLSNTKWDVENWSPQMLETAFLIAQKWKKGLNH